MIDVVVAGQGHDAVARLGPGRTAGNDAAALAELPEGGDAVVANEQQARALTGADPEDAVHALADRYRLACVTLGARGALAVLDGELERGEPPERALQEAPGAGDAFAA